MRRDHIVLVPYRNMWFGIIGFWGSGFALGVLVGHWIK